MEMTKQQHHEAIRFALRAINKLPKAFLFVTDFDEMPFEQWQGIPIFYGLSMTDHLTSLCVYECPFVPLFDAEGTSYSQRVAFVSAWDDFVCALKNVS